MRLIDAHLPLHNDAVAGEGYLCVYYLPVAKRRGFGALRRGVADGLGLWQKDVWLCQERARSVSICPFVPASKASKLSTWGEFDIGALEDPGACRPCCLRIRHHTSAYVSIRQHTSSCRGTRGSRCLSPLLPALRQHTSAYVSIRQHTPDIGAL